MKEIITKEGKVISLEMNENPTFSQTNKNSIKEMIEANKDKIVDRLPGGTFVMKDEHGNTDYVDFQMADYDYIFKKQYVDDCRKKWSIFKDRLRQYSIYTDEVMDKCERYDIWADLMRNAKQHGVSLKETKEVRERINRERRKNEEQRDAVVPLSSYSKEQLIALYKSYTTYYMTEWIINRKRYHEDKNIEMLDTDKVSFINKFELYQLKISNLEYELQNEEISDSKKQEINDKINLYQILSDIILFCTDLYAKYLTSGTDEMKELVEDREYELHMNDEYDVEIGKATRIEIYHFIYNTLRYLSIKDLNKLLLLADKKFDDRSKVKSLIGKKIFKYDLDGNLLAVYNSRQECMEDNNIKKSLLSQILAGKRGAKMQYKLVEEKIS